MLKKHGQQVESNRNMTTLAEVEMLARKLMDNIYSAQGQTPKIVEKQSRTTISLPEAMLRQCEDFVIKNKRSGNDPKNVSALVRVALDEYFNK